MSEFISTSKSANAQAHAPVFGEPISLTALRAAFGPFDVVTCKDSRFVKTVNHDGSVGDTIAFVSKKCDTSKPMHVVNVLLWSEITDKLTGNVREDYVPSRILCNITSVGERQHVFDALNAEFAK